MSVSASVSLDFLSFSSLSLEIESGWGLGEVGSRVSRGISSVIVVAAVVVAAVAIGNGRSIGKINSGGRDERNVAEVQAVVLIFFFFRIFF